MKTAIFLYGPSGVGKTTLARKIAVKYGFKHCDSDYFMLAFSKEYSKEREIIGIETNYNYARNLVKRGHSIITEVLKKSQISSLKKLMKKDKYRIIEISLVGSLEKCLSNNKMRKERRYPEHKIKNWFEQYSSRKGNVIDVSKMSEKQVFAAVEKIINSLE